MILPETAAEDRTKPIELHHEVWEGQEPGNYWFVVVFVRHVIRNAERTYRGDKFIIWDCNYPSFDRGRPSIDEELLIQKELRKAIRKNTESVRAVEIRNLSGPDQDKFARMSNRNEDNIRYESLIRSISRYCKRADGPPNDLQSRIAATVLET